MTDLKNILWTSSEIAAATGGEASRFFEGMGVSIDTRTVQKGDIFLALKGDRLDGHAYVDQALQAGAAGAIVHKGFISQVADAPLLFVDDTMQALEALGCASRARTTAKVIGVTGSAGKTGTKEMLALVLAGFGKTHYSKKSFNNHWGVPLTLANMPKDTQFAVFEMGMNHAGEMAHLTQQVKPHMVLITTIEPAHIEHFKTVEAIADAKAEIFQGLENDGVAVLSIDNSQYLRLKTHAEKAGVRNIYSFGEDDLADSRLTQCTLNASSSKITADILGETIRYTLNIPGVHIAINSLAALTVVKLLGCNLAQAAERIKDAEPVTGRGNRIEVTVATGQPPVMVIDESYNANPASMKAAFGVFELVQTQGEGRHIAVLGDMLELGRDGPRLHAELANPLLKAKVDMLFCCGPQMDALYQSLPEGWRGAHANDSQSLAPLVAQNVKAGDVVLVKGSAGSKMAYVVEALRALGNAQK